ncbi:MAG: flagellar biosynthesis protein FlhA, partial [Candidatus Sericytochromatia bacterium]|nr:flagellar biosynthesis protein FlhA [Candidatus Sericytochromatia bacterium]
MNAEGYTSTMAANINPAQPVGLAQFLRSGDFVLAVAMVLVVGMMVVPLPSPLLDLLLVTNITLALTMLMVSLYVQRPLEFSTFPSLLLILTLFRLALNVATTRLVLLNAEAGRVIEAFGTFVVGGNYAVGVVIFIILIVIQFIVVTSGAGRISEVAARFTLDAMPGKQMAVDADLNAGIIDEAEAKKRRSDIARESDFFGAMDGASKFVRGDAVAGIVITLVNIVGGFVVGMLMLDMDALTSLETFTHLTIGDGLVGQIPSLMISTAAGIIVTRAASKANLGEEITGQLTQSPSALYVSAVVMGGLALVPGLPHLPFFLLAVGTAAVAYGKTRAQQQEKLEAETPKPQAARAPEEDRIENYLAIDQMELEIGY